ncbi:MAG: Hsp20/alpha crystallin family protein [Bacillaceae bacterium]
MFDLIPRKHYEDTFKKMLKAMNEFFDEPFDNLLGNEPHSFRTDIIEKDDAYYVEAELPGFTKDDIQVEIENNYLTIRAKREEKNEAKDENRRFIRQERRYGEYVRRFYVDNINEQDIKAKLENGVLKLEIPKYQPEKSKKKQIPIE